MPLKIYRIKSEAEPSRLGNAIIDDETVVEEKEKKKGNNNNNNSFHSIRIIHFKR